jgi:peptide/nickel transport system ATP-binding protein
MNDVLLSVRNLNKHFPIRKGFLNRVVGLVRAVDDVSFDVMRGECLGLVGESGCGKTTLVRTLLRAYTPTSGQALLTVAKQDGERGSEARDAIDLAALERDELKALRPHFQMIFQDPFSSLNPRMTVERIVGEPLKVNGIGNKTERRTRVAGMIARCGMDTSYLSRYPHAFSGGQRQRIGIARALVLEPELVVADEAVSALDVSVQAQILNLLRNLQQELNLTYIFIAHNLGVVRHSTDRIAVMYCGSIVELGPSHDVYETPRHPYTKALISAIPEPNPKHRMNRAVLKGDVADPAHPPTGCKFHPRCPIATERCQHECPTLKAGPDGRQVACHLAE